MKTKLLLFVILISCHQVAKADPFDILFQPATYTNGSQTDTFQIVCGDNVVLPPGGTLTFVVYSFSLSISNTMILSSGHLPPGANFPTAFGMTYVQSTFTWTPTGSFVGNIEFHLRGTATVDCTVAFDWVLPVELTSFTSFVHGNNVTLRWRTNSENNNLKFVIEKARTTNGNNNDWRQSGSVMGNGTTSSPSDYTFTERNLNSGTYQYRLRQEDFNGNFEYHYLNNNIVIGLPEKFELSQNYPNPFNPVTVIRYSLIENGFTTLKVFDALGKEVDLLVNEKKDAGRYTFQFNGNNFASGVYFYQIQAGDFVETKRMLLLK
jgi:hypothetical protein